MHLVTLKGHTGVLWGPSEFILDPMGRFCIVILRRAALVIKYECLVWALLQKAAVYAQYREMALPFWNRIICSCWRNFFKQMNLPFALCTIKRISGLIIPSASVGI
jgi:hypothetical protein